jgi:hypothetical protein
LRVYFEIRFEGGRGSKKKQEKRGLELERNEKQKKDK